MTDKSSLVKIGVLGAGHLGKIHIRLLLDNPAFDICGFYDPDKSRSSEVSEQTGLKRFDSMADLIDAVDAVDIVTPTLSHFDCARAALRKSRHIFIEKPLTTELEEAKSLISLVEEADVIAQVGHVERFNPAFLSLSGMEIQPMFIEAHRLAGFNPRGTDVSVVLDLMIHDIDLVLSLVNSSVKRVNASGVAVVSDSPDIANARIEFDNGCVANLTASRISLKNMRKMRLFQKNAYITMDFAEKKSQVFKLQDVGPQDTEGMMTIDSGDGKPRKSISFEEPEAPRVNSIGMELDEFADCILHQKEPRVGVLDGFRAMEIANMVLDRINKSQFI